jgi:tRNA(fMet)-specific endonuclease VapC
MGVILDTDILIDVERGALRLDFSKYDRHGGAYLSAITVSELLVGVHRADTEERRIRRSAFVEAVISRIPSLAFDETVARNHAALLAHLPAKRILVDAHDLIIAATAVTFGFPLLTRNVSHFGGLSGLEILPAK